MKLQAKVALVTGVGIDVGPGDWPRPGRQGHHHGRDSPLDQVASHIAIMQ